MCTDLESSTPEMDAATRNLRVAVVVVGYHNADDVIGCLRALCQLAPDPPFDVFIAENGGPQGMDALLAALEGSGSPCRVGRGGPPPALPFPVLRHRAFDLKHEDAAADSRVLVAEMVENLGYGGAVNAWLRPLFDGPGWRGAWVLNPDTEPEPEALRELVRYSALRGKGMVGSRIMAMDDPGRVRTRGLSWRKLSSRTAAVDLYAPMDVEPDEDDVEARLDAPSGSSLYVTRELVEHIGLMDEQYFLFFEDLEWGTRAKAVGALGHAHRSAVPHKGGTTIGGAGGRTAVSQLSVYLEFRNRILFVRQRHPAWLAWTVLAQAGHALAYLAAGSATNAATAMRGVAAGARGEVGRPDHIVAAHDKPRPR